MYRESGKEGFLLLPDLNWDRKTMSSLHLLGLVERRDIWSVRDLRKGDVEWVRHMQERLLDATVGLYPEIERDQLKLYVHCKLRTVIRIVRMLEADWGFRSTHILPLPHPHRPRRPRSRFHASYRQSPRPGEHHLPARNHGRRQRRRHGRREPHIPSRRAKRAMAAGLSAHEASRQLNLFCMSKDIWCIWRTPMPIRAFNET